MKEILWHRVVAFFGGSEKDDSRMNPPVTWNQFNSYFYITTHNGKRLRKRRWEVDHIWTHTKTLVEAMVIVHYKDHRKTGRRSL